MMIARDRSAESLGSPMDGKLVRLEPLGMQHVAGLVGAASDPSIWTYSIAIPIRSARDAIAFVENALDGARGGHEIPFAIVDARSGRVVGTTRFLEIEPEYRCLEIGITWIAKPFHGTGINVEAKYLMLCAAFRAGMVRVGFQADHRNGRSQAALRKIGATYEGTLRRYHAHERNAHRRDTVIYSIIDTEWTDTERRIQALLERYYDSFGGEAQHRPT